MKGLIFTYALTYGGSVVSLFRPWYGLLIYIAFAILRPEALWHWSVPRGDYSLTIAIAFLVGWVLHGCGTWKLGRSQPILLCLLVFWAWLAFQIAYCPDTEATLTAVTQLSKIYLPFVVGLSLLDSVEKLKQLAWTLVLAQGYLAFEFNLNYYNNPNFIPDEWQFAGLDNNGIAISICSTIGMAFFLGLYSKKLWQKLIALAAAGFMSHVVLFSMSRGGMLALVVTAVATFVLVPKKPKSFALFALGVAIGLRLAGPMVMEEFKTAFAPEEARDSSATSRVHHWNAALKSMAGNPVGVGLDRWGEVAPRYGLNKGQEAHNTWLQLGAELGVIGLSAILGFYWIGIRRLWPIARQKKLPPEIDPFLPAAACMVITSFIGFFVSASFVTVEGVEPPYYVMLAGAGILRVLSARETVSAAAPQMAWAQLPQQQLPQQQPAMRHVRT